MLKQPWHSVKLWPMLHAPRRTSNRIQKRYESNSITVSLPEFKLHKLEAGPPTQATLTKEEGKKYLLEMDTMRRMEQTAAELYRSKIIRGFCHLYVGQEAVAVGIRAAMRDVDEVITAYRCHGFAQIMGATPTEILLELTGHVDGLMRGRGGSMHLYAPRFYGGNGIVGAHVPVGTGAALACKYKNNGGVCFTVYGDGAANQGQVFESYNMACLWKLPVIYCCEDNKYGLGTAANRASCDTNFYSRGDFIPGIRVDGMNILTVRTAVQFAIDYVLKNGPIILEFDTYRFVGHSMSDPGTSYRKREDVQEMRRGRDPITNFVEILKENQLMTNEEYKNYDKQIKNEFDEFKKTLATAKDPEPHELTADVYASCLEKQIRGISNYNLSHSRIGQPFLPLDT